MQNNSTHAMFPEATHDEQSMQSFIKTLRVHTFREFEGVGREIIETEVEPTYRQANNGERPTRKHMREALLERPEHCWWSSLLRTTQEMLYDSVGPSIERQLPDLIDRAKGLRGQQGDLVLDPTVTIPRYLSAVDIHCKPGSYQQELTEDDVFAGAEFDRTYRLYSMGLNGPNLDAAGWSMISWIKKTYPDFKPKRILDMGCTIGHSTLPYTTAFGDDVEVYAIDVAAPCLRYAHARAVAMGKRVFFSQQNAEHTNFADGSFDLIVSNILMHETSRAALDNIFKETNRLLAPGGLMAHGEGVRRHDLFNTYYSEWMAHFNNEPFLGTVQDVDFMQVCETAGFDPDVCRVDDAPRHRLGEEPDPSPRVTLQIVSGRKAAA